MVRFLLVLMAAGIIVTGCQTDNTNNNMNGVGERVALSVSLSETRTSLGDKSGELYRVNWSEGDQIVVNGVLSERAVIDAENSSRATFEIENSPGYPFYITYPYCDATSADKPIVKFPPRQAYTEGTFALGSAPMCGYAEGKNGEIELSHLAAVLRIPVKAMYEGVTLEKVVISSDSGAALAGEFEVDCKNATMTKTKNIASSMTYTLPSKFALSTEEESVFYIAVPPLKVGKYTIEFVETSGSKMAITWAPDNALSSGVVREFNTVVYRPSLKKYAEKDEIKIMSFNVRTTLTESNTANNWDNRKKACIEIINDHQPTIIGVQEAKYAHHWTYLKEQLADNYTGYGVNRDTGKESGTGEVMGILYNKDLIEKLDGGTFWLSETPDVPSKGFGANYSRCATWGLFKHKATAKKFCYINTHIDHQVEAAKFGGMNLISEFFGQYKDEYLLFLTGDFNMTSDHKSIDPIESYMYNTREVAPEWLTDYDTTFNGFTTGKNSIIDHIYCSNYLKVVEYHTIDEQYNNTVYCSDHYPVYAIIKLK